MPIELTASQALGLWHGVALDQVRHDDRDLTSVSYTHLTLPTIYSV